ncbi:MAG: hypothetical protein ABIK28_03575 [Planctomycetota bacterium]
MTNSLIEVFVSEIGIRNARMSLSATVHTNEWSLPGAKYDRYVTEVHGSVATNIPNTDLITSNSYIEVSLVDFYEDIVFNPSICQGIGQTGNYSQSRGSNVEAFGMSGISRIEAIFGGSTSVPGGGGVWIFLGSNNVSLRLP